ncbi:hypothetical protein D3C72_2265510 [compost metagenome]
MPGDAALEVGPGRQQLRQACQRRALRIPPARDVVIAFGIGLDVHAHPVQVAQHVRQPQRIDARGVQAHAISHALDVTDHGGQAWFAERLAAGKHHRIQ